MTLTSRSAWRAAGAVILIGAVVAGAAWGFQRLTTRRGGVRYITRSVTYADIAASVNETGTVNPVDVVQVGSQVSGTIVTLNVDYNSKVTKGEVLATLDPTTFRAAAEQVTAGLEAAQSSAAATQSGVLQAQAAVENATASLLQVQANLRSAQANVGKANAQLALANLTVERDTSLLQQGFIAQNQMDADRTAAAASAGDYRVAQDAAAAAEAQVNAAEAQLRGAQAQVKTSQAQAAASQHQVASAAAQLQQAQYNLSRTVITSPIDGVVLARNVSIGQTVAASFQTPTLFTLASNLTNMQVDTSVDEADVGNVRDGETARISVTAFPNVTFAGSVQQVRVNPTVVQNVVTYDAVVIVHDTSGRLLPGMTAQVAIDVGKRTHVLTLPITALLYRPLSPGGGSPSGAPGSPQAAAPGNGSAGVPVAGAAGSQVTVWVLRNGRPQAVPVVIGLSDGQNVEIASGNLHAGDPVIIAQARGQARSSAPQGPGGGLGPGGGR